MTNTKSVVFILTMFFYGLCFGYKPKEGNISAALGPYLHRTDFSLGRTQKDSRYHGGLGLIVTGDLSQKGALEITFLQMYKTYFREDQGRFLGAQTGLLHIAMGYRWWLSSIVSTSLAFYSAYSIGDVHYTLNEFPLDQEIETSANDITEYGFDLSSQVEVWTDSRLSVVVEGRYSYSVTNKSHEYGNHYGFFIGIKRLIQEKERKKVSTLN